MTGVTAALLLETLGKSWRGSSRLASCVNSGRSRLVFQLMLQQSTNKHHRLYRSNRTVVQLALQNSTSRCRLPHLHDHYLYSSLEPIADLHAPLLRIQSFQDKGHNMHFTAPQRISTDPADPARPYHHLSPTDHLHHNLTTPPSSTTSPPEPSQQPHRAPATTTSTP